MKESDVFLLGKISKKHGFKGDLNIKIFIDPFKKLKELKFLFIKMDNSLVPFFLKNIAFKNKKFIVVSFEDVENDSQANELINNEVYIPADFLPEEINDQKNDLTGYVLIDKNLGELGIIENMLSNNAQDLIQISINSNQVLIPFVQEFVVDINKKSKTIIVKTPSGLIDLYLQ